MKNLFPQNLKEITDSSEDLDANLPFEVSSDLRCSCGNDEFQVFNAVYSQTKEEKERTAIIKDLIQRYADVLKADGNSFASKIEGEKEIFGYMDDHLVFHKFYEIKCGEQTYKPTIVKIKCPDCGKEYEIFNSAKNGYDAICNCNPSKVEKFRAMKKKSCFGCKNDGYKVNVKISSLGKKELIADSFLTEDNWTDAYDWIRVDLKCSQCGKVTKKFLDMETM